MGGREVDFRHSQLRCHLFQIGRCLTVFDDDIATDEELVAALKTGRDRGVYLDGCEVKGLVER